MNKMINFAIDLGTTNSLIAKFDNGAVEVFKNPNGFKETLPSVVGFRNDRILSGDQAKTFVGKDPKNVKSRFKRMMGTTESFRIETLDRSTTPVELSSFIMKELKTFIHTGEVPEAVVITVPASFDMVQSNATTEAGYAAGFKQVVIFQEPIAASLAYANREKGVDLKNSQWIVYDLGGGTFDVALIRIVEGELKVVDHEGDNFLGGMDFDDLLVERLIAPQLEKRGKFTDLVPQMKSNSGRFNRLWHSLLSLAEQAKIELSTKTSAEIDLGLIHIEDDNGKIIDDYIEITRSEFEALIKEDVDKTAAMLKKILTRNSLRPDDLKFVLMVGGSTYIPFVRKRIEELLGIPVNTGINPTNAIVIGAAYFAATKKVDIGEGVASKKTPPGSLKIKAVYNRASQEYEEMFSAKVEGEFAGLFYRIQREDGGYDSGLRELSSRINEDLPLQAEAFNHFSFTVYDSSNNPIPTDFDSIQIAQGTYSPAGQMVPHDLSLVLDTADFEDTRLHCIFEKNSIIPARSKKTVVVGKTVTKGSTDDIVRIIVVEGPRENHHTANRMQGELLIRGNQLQRDVPRGTEIDLTFELSESRDLTVTAYIHPSGPEFSQVFVPRNREVNIEGLVKEVEFLENRIESEMEDAVKNEKYELAKEIEKLRTDLYQLRNATVRIATDDVTDEKMKLDETKRGLAQELGRLTGDKRISRLRSEYQTTKEEVTNIVNESGNDIERRQLREIVTREHTFLQSANPKKIEEAINDLHRLEFQILRRKPDFLIGMFRQLTGKSEIFNDQTQARNLIAAGKSHLATEDWSKLDEVICCLFRLLPEGEAASAVGFTWIIADS
jgi:molecular chaperone DnaK